MFHAVKTTEPRLIAISLFNYSSSELARMHPTRGTHHVGLGAGCSAAFRINWLTLAPVLPLYCNLHCGHLTKLTIFGPTMPPHQLIVTLLGSGFWQRGHGTYGELGGT